MEELLTDDEDFAELVQIVRHPRQPRTFRVRPNNLTKWSEEEYRNRFRLSKDIVTFLDEEISLQISPKTNRNHALTSREMIELTLRFFASGSFLQTVGDFSGVDKSTASRVVIKVARAIAGLHEQYIHMPNSEEETSSVIRAFYMLARFPKCIGAVDCTHVKIQSPGGDEAENYRNRKNFFSFNVQAVGDANLLIRDIVCRWPGSAHDANIFRNSNIRQKFENNVFGNNVIVGDSGYGIQNYLITPLRNPRTPAEQLFNESQIRTRNPIERLFGVWKRRFPILALGIRLDIQKVEAIVVATAVLHNIACIFRDEEPSIDEDIEIQINATIFDAQEIIDQANNHNNNDNITRQVLINQYFQNLL